MKALWKVPASVALLVVIGVALFVLTLPAMLLTFPWLVLSMAGVLGDDVDPPMFWLLERVSDIFGWWHDL